jgi:hypothetical protein
MQPTRKLWLSALAVLCLALPAAADDAKLENLKANRWMPADAEIVFGVNFRQMLTSPMVKPEELEQNFKTLIKQNKQAEQMLQAAGIDPLKDIDGVLLTVSGIGPQAKVRAVVQGRFKEDKIQSAAQDFAKKQPERLKVTKQDGKTVYEATPEKGNGQPLYAAFADRNTLVLTSSKEYTLQSITEDGKKPAEVGKKMKEALAPLSGKESLWFAAIITDQVKQLLKNNAATGGFAANLESVTGSMNLTNALQVLLKIHTTNAQSAEQIKGLFDQFKPLLEDAAKNNEEAGPVLTEVLQNLKVNTQKGDVNITLKLSQDALKKIEDTVKKNTGTGGIKKKDQ